jgi:hypothetical protein
MVFRAELYNPDRGEANAVRVEFPIKDYGKAYDALRHIGIGSAIAQDCRIKSIEGDYPVLEVLAGANANVDELDYLAKRLDGFWGAEATQFGAAATARGIQNIDDFINLTFSCQTVTVVSDFSDLEAVGKAHYINKNGGAVATSAMEGVDFKQEALDLLQSGKGVITPCGLVFDNGMEMERLYEGKEFPPYLYEPPVAVLWVRHESTPEASPTCLYLPMPKECMERALERGGWTNDWSDIAIAPISIVPRLSTPPPAMPGWGCALKKTAHRKSLMITVSSGSAMFWLTPSKKPSGTVATENPTRNGRNPSSCRPTKSTDILP